MWTNRPIKRFGAGHRNGLLDSIFRSVKYREVSDLQHLLNNAWTMRRNGDYHAASAIVDQVEALVGQDDYLVLGRLRHVRAQFARDHGRTENALELYKQSLASYEKSGSRQNIAHAARHVADVATELGLLEEAGTHYRKALDLYRSSPAGSSNDLANALRGYALFCERSAKPMMARATWTEVRALYERLGIQPGVDEADAHLDVLEEE